jgi:hypothetical protein
MRLPSADEYIQIISKKKEDLPTLRNYNFHFEENGKALFYRKSRRAIVFKAEYNSKAYAIRFYLNDDPEFFKRYQKIHDYLEEKPFSWKVPFHFSGEGYNPMVKMDWIESISLSQYLDLIIKDTTQITNLQSRFFSLHRELEGNGIAHSNLNMKHVRFIKQGQEYILKLIDYDAMFLPSFKGEDSITTGMPGFQHPMRLASDFSETIDRFSFWIFLTALEAFKMNPSLWQNAKQNGFNKEEQILFTYSDLALPRQSETFQLLKQTENKALKFYTEKLIEFCNASSLESIEIPRLYDEKDLHSAKNENIYASKENSKPVVVKKQDVRPPTIVSEKPIVQKAPPAAPVTQSQKKENVALPQEPKKQKIAVTEGKIKRQKPVAAILIIGLLILSGGYFVWASYIKKDQDKTVINNNPPSTNSRPSSIVNHGAQEKVFFNSSNISQFLFKLYQSYNKRDLSSILGNYADSLNQYYDAGVVKKNELRVIIRDLFIKPAFYECNPDLATLQFSTKGNTCNVTVNIHETIKPNARSKTENYSSKIEYLLDSTFKIQSEKNVE